MRFLPCPAALPPGDEGRAPGHCAPLLRQRRPPHPRTAPRRTGGRRLVREPRRSGASRGGLVFGGMNKVLWMIHQPPSDLGMDVCSDGRRVGSPTVLQFIWDQQPLLGCSGHIHESPHQPGGQWGVQVGRTLWLQPGQLDRRLHYVTVNLGLDFEIRSARHSLFGELGSHPVAPVPIGSASSPSPQPQPLLVASHATAAAAPASIPVDGRPPPATRSTPSPDSAAGCSRC